MNMRRYSANRGVETIINFWMHVLFIFQCLFYWTFSRWFRKRINRSPCVLTIFGQPFCSIVLMPPYVFHNAQSYCNVDLASFTMLTSVAIQLLTQHKLTISSRKSMDNSQISFSSPYIWTHYSQWSTLGSWTVECAWVTHSLPVQINTQMKAYQRCMITR